MFERFYLKRLRRDLPRWQARGIIGPEAPALVLADLAEQSASSRAGPMALAILGALVFAAGAILFFAANWQALPKLAKLALLFGAMWAAFGAAARLGGPRGGALSRLAEPLMLLGVLLFGANIWLIAQIYHIDSHYPNGLLAWSLAGLGGALLVGSQASAALGLALALGWSVSEMMDFDWSFHWPFLILFLPFAGMIVWRVWRIAGAIALFCLLAWSVVVFIQETDFISNRIALLAEFYLLAGMGVYVAGAYVARSTRLEPFALMLERFGLIAGAWPLYVLSLRETYNLVDVYEYADRGLSGASPAWLVAMVVLALAVIGFGARALMTGEAAPLTRKVGLVILALVGLLIGGTLAGIWSAGGDLVPYLIANVAYFGAMIWLILAGYHQGDRFQVNLAFVGFAIGVLTLYFDTFFADLDRSLFFMGGGALLLITGFLIERQRRRVMRAIGKMPASGVA